MVAPSGSFLPVKFTNPDAGGAAAPGVPTVAPSGSAFPVKSVRSPAILVVRVADQLAVLVVHWFGAGWDWRPLRSFCNTPRLWTRQASNRLVGFLACRLVRLAEGIASSP